MVLGGIVAVALSLGSLLFLGLLGSMIRGGGSGTTPAWVADVLLFVVVAVSTLFAGVQQWVYALWTQVVVDEVG
jgi:hypothetical protein